MLMDHKNGPSSKPKMVSERFSRAIRATTPSRTTRFNPHHHRNDAAVVSVTAPNVSLVPPPKGEFCLRVSKQSITPSNYEGQQSVSVPIIFDATHSSDDSVVAVQPYGQGASGAMSLNGVFSEYIDRAGEKIRSPTIVSDTKASMKYDSFNAKVSEYIDQTRHRFHMPSSLGVSEIV